MQLAQTECRNAPSRRQEGATRAILRAAGLEENPEKGELILLSDLPAGTYRLNETKVAGTKCDVPVRLWDGRMMLIECKVSNSAASSVKRLIREVCGKASAWRRKFGDEVILAVVIDGVFKLINLKQAQNEFGVYIFWENSLSELSSFIESVK